MSVFETRFEFASAPDRPLASCPMPGRTALSIVIIARFDRRGNFARILKSPANRDFRRPSPRRDGKSWQLKVDKVDPRCTVGQATFHILLFKEICGNSARIFYLLPPNLLFIHNFPEITLGMLNFLADFERASIGASRFQTKAAS
jgi:hypothetical protein